uniref:Uncharacterized protein n=1 Tax=Ditylenchus dipsaci TaxID=166011 RepID=A0A915CY21_9BILA
MEVYLTGSCALGCSTKESSLNPFKVCGLTDAGDGSEDDFIHCFKAHGPIPEGKKQITSAEKPLIRKLSLFSSWKLPVPHDEF